MNTPVTRLDRRYSQPDAVAAEWEETRRALESAELFWISTVRADGRPHVTPVVTDEDTLRRLAKAWATKWEGRWQFTVRDGCFQHGPGVPDNSMIHPE